MAEASQQTAGGPVVPRALTWPRRIASAVVLVFMRALMATWRIRWRDRAQIRRVPGPVIFCTWHNRLAVTLACYGDFVRTQWPCVGMGAMISASRDGTFLASLVEPFGVVPIRGSSSRRGAQAMLEAATWMEKKYSVCWTPDGPRGPVYQIQRAGIIKLAQMTGCPIIPISSDMRWKIRLRSWDRFQIPLPFARCVMRAGEPLWVPIEATPEECERLRGELEKQMTAITED